MGRSCHFRRLGASEGSGDGPLTPKRPLCGHPQDPTDTKPPSRYRKSVYFPVHERAMPHVSQSSKMFSVAVTRTPHANVQPAETPMLHELTTSSRDTTPSLRP